MDKMENGSFEKHRVHRAVRFWGGLNFANFFRVKKVNVKFLAQSSDDMLRVAVFLKGC